MSSSALKIIAGIMVLLAVVLGAVTIKVYRQNAETAQQAVVKAAEQQKAPQVLAVVAIKPLPAYKRIERDAIGLVSVSVAPASYFTSVDDVIARVPLVDIDAGAPITPRYFKEGNILARSIPAGYEAVSVEVNDVIAVGGFLRPGDIVDVLLFLRSGAGVDQPQSRVLLRQARLLAYEEHIIDRPEGLDKQESNEQKQRRTRTAVLAVPSADTTKLMLGVSMGELRLSLHAQAADAETQGEQADPTMPVIEAGQESEKMVTAAELSRPGASSSKKATAAAPPPPVVEVYRGSQRERVVTRN